MRDIRHEKSGLYSRNYPRVRERKAPGRAPADRAAGTALSRTGFWGQRPQILLNVGAHTNENSVGRARADDAVPPILQKGRIGRRAAPGVAAAGAA